MTSIQSVTNGETLLIGTKWLRLKFCRFCLWSREEVEAYLEERRRLDEAVRQENETRFPPAGIRERLLARRAHQP